mgnify:CR=1 FL=1
MAIEENTKKTLINIGLGILALVVVLFATSFIHEWLLASGAVIPIFCLIIIVIVIFGAMGAMGINPNTPFSDNNGIVSDIYSGVLASLITLAVVIKVFEFSIEPLYISDEQVALEVLLQTKEADSSFSAESIKKAKTDNLPVIKAISKHKILKFEVWLYLSVIGVLAGLVGRRLLDSFSNKFASELEKRLGVELKAMKQHFESEIKSEKLLNEATRKQDKGFHQEAVDLFNQAIKLEPSVRSWSLLSFSQSYLKQEDAYELALKSNDEAIKLITDTTDNADIFNTYYNRACYLHLANVKKSIPLDTYLDDLCENLTKSFNAEPETFKRLFFNDLKKDGNDFTDLISKLEEEKLSKLIVLVFSMPIVRFVELQSLDDIA